MRRSLAKILPALVLLGTLPLLGACNTVSGAGQDVSAVGNAVSRGANSVTPGR